MKTRDVLLKISSFWLLSTVVMIVSYSLSGQAQLKQTTITDERDLTGATSPRRVIVTRTQQDGRTSEKKVVEGPSINGGYAPLVETEQQTIQLNPNAATVVTRQYSRDANGKRQLVAITEEQRSTAATGRETLLRITSNVDLNGRLQVVQREVRETVPAGDDTWQTTSTISRQTANGFQPVLRSQQIEQRKGDVAEQHTTVLVPDGNGNFVPLSRTESTTTKTASGQTKDERIYRVNGYFDHMTVVQHDVSTESKDAKGSHSATQAYSVFVPGAFPVPGSLAFVRQISSSRQTAPDGSSQAKQQLQVINSGNPSSGLQLVTSASGTSQSADGQTTRQIVVRSSDGNRNFRVVWIHNSQETRACFINGSLKGRGFSRRGPQRVPLLHGLGWKPRRPEPGKTWALAPEGINSVF
jgi:hypothetical protein